MIVSIVHCFVQSSTLYSCCTGCVYVLLKREKKKLDAGGWGEVAKRKGRKGWAAPALQYDAAGYFNM